MSPVVAGTSGAGASQVMGTMPRAPHTTIQHRLVTVSASSAAAATAAVTAAARSKLTALSVSSQSPFLLMLCSRDFSRILPAKLRKRNLVYNTWTWFQDLMLRFLL